MKSRTIYIVLLGIIAMLGCATAPQEPDWVGGNSSAYDSSRYLIGRGQSDVPAVARDRARADLAKIFKVSISENTKDMQTYVGSTDGSGSQGQLGTEISRNIETRTDQIIEGMRIAEAWQDPKTRAHHALAVLDRIQIGNRLRQDMMNLDSAIQSHVTHARNSENLFRRISSARQALAAQLERNQYQKYLAIVDRTGNGAAPLYDAARLAADLKDLLQRLRISPRVVNDPLGGLSPVVAGALANAGFLHEADPESADYILDANLKIDQLADGQGWYWVRGTMDIVLIQKKDNKVLGSHRWDIKASSQQKEVANRRALDQLAEALNKELGKVLTGLGSPET